MDLLTHLFLPLTVAYVIRREVFASPAHLGLALLGLLPDVDKYLLAKGYGHSLVTLGPLCAAILAVEYRYRGELRIAPVAVGLVASHLLLDFVGGSQVPLLYPFLTEGIALRYPASTVFGTGAAGMTVVGPVVDLKTASPRPGVNTYGFLRPAGVANLLGFLAVYAGLAREE